MQGLWGVARYVGGHGLWSQCGGLDLLHCSYKVQYCFILMPNPPQEFNIASEMQCHHSSKRISHLAIYV